MPGVFDGMTGTATFSYFLDVLPQAIRVTDFRIYRWLGELAGNWALDRLVSQEEANNIFKGGLFFAVYWWQWFRAGTDREKPRRAIIAIMIGALVGLIVGRTISFVVPFRLRPIYNPALPHPVFSVPLSANLENWS